jgi:hypothetical protein
MNRLADLYVDYITLCLNEDVFGANGELTEEQIRERLIHNIREQTEICGDLIPIRSAANLLLSMHRHMSERAHEMLVSAMKS